jgi:Family of unknown function (DUF6247)
MTKPTTVLVGRAGPAIRAALVEHGRPGDVERFEAELRGALSAAADDLDVARAERVLRRWQALATMVANPLTADERAQLARARAGDLAGLVSPDDPGQATAV